jgi:hypothetical protein
MSPTSWRRRCIAWLSPTSSAVASRDSRRPSSSRRQHSSCERSWFISSDPATFGKRIEREVAAWGAVIQREAVSLD